MRHHDMQIHRSKPIPTTTLFQVHCSCGHRSAPTTDIGEARHDEAMHYVAQGK